MAQKLEDSQNYGLRLEEKIGGLEEQNASLSLMVKNKQGYLEQKRDAEEMELQLQ